MTDSRRLVLTAALTISVLLTATAAPIPPPKKRPEPTRWLCEIDFAQMSPTKCCVTICLRVPGLAHSHYFGLDAGLSPAEIRDDIFRRFAGDDTFAPRKVGLTAIAFEAPLSEGTRQRCECTARADVLVEVEQPVVRRVPVK